MKKILFLFVFIASVVNAQQIPFVNMDKHSVSGDGTPPATPIVTWTSRPVNMQLYARESNDSAVVEISGTINTAGYDSVFVRVYREYVLEYTIYEPLIYAGNNAEFEVNVKIKSELANYQLCVYFRSTGFFDTLSYSVDSVVAGDVYIIAGQSNGQKPDLSVTTYDEYCRTFGVQTDSLNTSNYVAGDTIWRRSSANYDGYAIFPRGNYPQNVSVLGMTLQKYLCDSCATPTALINGTRWGTSISSWTPNITNRTDFSYYYGKLLYRMQKAKLANKVKAIIWYQGEIDVNASAGSDPSNPRGIAGYSGYASKFDSLYNAFKSDYIALTKIYVLQVRPLSCAGSSTYAQELRETQRQLQTTYADVEVVSTMGIDSYNLCHYFYQGYQQLGDILFKTIGKTFYPTDNVGLYDTTKSRPPSVDRAFYTSTAKTKIGITFSNSTPNLIPADTTIGGFTINVKNYFYLNKIRTSSNVDSLTLSSAKDTLYIWLNAATTASRLAYIPNRNDANGNIYNGPFIRNARGLAMLSFDNLVIYESELPFAVLELTSLLEGFYDSGSNLSIRDTLTVNLRQRSSPYNLVESRKVYMKKNGTDTVKYLTAINSTNYYIQLKHRNALETWSAGPIMFTEYSGSYDFSTSGSQAFGSNQVQKGSRFCLYSGDANSDGIIDLNDLSDIDNDAFDFVVGYEATDINGNDFIDLNDLSICDNNALNIVYVKVP